MNPRVIFFHFLIWAIYSQFNFLISVLMGDEPLFIDFCVKYAIAAIVFYYTALFIYESYIKNGGYFYLGAFLFTSVFINFGLRYMAYFVILPGHWGFKKPTIYWKQYFIMSLWWWFQYSLFALGYWHYKKSIKTEKQLRISEMDNLQLQNQKVILENNFLKTQINPHFLYNTLSFLYSKTARHSDEPAKAIELLTDIMRYGLENDTPDGMVTLDKEVAHLDNYIGLNQLRYNNKLQINFDKSIDSPQARIPHYTLITFVENAFKHGIVTDAAYPLCISVYCTPEQLKFSVHNRKDKASNKPNQQPGVGLSNVRDRLRLQYGDKQKIHITDEQDFFTICLVIRFA